MEGKGKVGDKGLRKEERRRLFQELEACACARGLHGSGKKWGVGGPRIAALIHFCVFPFSVLCGQGGTAQRGKTIYLFLVGEFQGAG